MILQSLARILRVPFAAFLLFGTLGGSLLNAEEATSVFEEMEVFRELIDDQNEVIVRQDSQIRQQQMQLDSLEARLESIAAEPQILPDEASAVIGYDGGFVIAGQKSKLDTGDATYQMRIGSWGQFRHNYFDSDGPNDDQNDFDIERIRLVFSGYAFTTDFEYFFQLDGDSDFSENVDMLDYYVTYDLGHDLFNCDAKRFRIRFGKWKIGFNRAREESGARMQFSDRATASVLFDFDRSLGVGALGNLGPLDWQFAVANGIDTGGFRPGRAGQLDTNLAIAGRINLLLTGDWGKDGHADFDWRTTPAVRVGGGYTYTNRELTGEREFDFPRVVDSGSQLDEILPPGLEDYNLYMYSADFNVKYRGFSWITEYYWRRLQDFLPDMLVMDQGFWMEAGYFLKPQHLQVLARWSRIYGNSGTIGGRDQSSDEVAIGSVFYIHGHNLKLTTDLTKVNGVPVSDSALNFRPGDDGILLRTQLQWKF